MEHKLYIYNTLSRKKEQFVPIHENKVGMYVCGPTVYGDGHLGHARPAITFDILFRYLTHLGYKVRYVRNITDVGHLENDADSGEDKIAKKARLDQLEPMEVVQYYVNRYHKAMEALNVMPPSIEPFASGHIKEQIDFVQKILNNGFAYESNGSVYFDVERYNQMHNYGKLSGRVIEELFENTRDLAGQSEKRKSVDFALWKKASPEHIMRWKGKFQIPNGRYSTNNKINYREFTSIGFPGWHLECSAMGTKYLGEEFDIHGGGMDLMFPHHECEIAQNKAGLGKNSVKYWMHNNMITINGQKMGKSLGNFITLEQFFNGNHPLLTQAFSPMTVRFFILQAKYNNTLDFSDFGLTEAQNKLGYLLDAYNRINKIKLSEISDSFARDLNQQLIDCEKAMNDDLNTPLVISYLIDAASTVNSAYYGQSKINEADLKLAKEMFDIYLFKLLVIKTEIETSSGNEAYKKAIDLLLNMRLVAKRNKDWATSDKIRNELTALGFEIKDTKDGFEWKI